jgi:hypothetical protein
LPGPPTSTANGIVKVVLVVERPDHVAAGGDAGDVGWIVVLAEEREIDDVPTGINLRRRREILIGARVPSELPRLRARNAGTTVNT